MKPNLPAQWEWTADELRRVGHRTVEMIVDHLVGLRDQPVVANDLVHFAGQGQVQEAQPIDLSALPTHDVPQIGNGGGVVKAPMKLAIGLLECLLVAGGCETPLVLENLLEARE